MVRCFVNNFFRIRRTFSGARLFFHGSIFRGGDPPATQHRPAVARLASDLKRTYPVGDYAWATARSGVLSGTGYTFILKHCPARRVDIRHIHRFSA